MGMFFKTLVAGVVAALLAGSVVYYGMPASETPNSVALRSQAQSEPKQDSWFSRVFRPVNYTAKPAPARRSNRAAAPSLGAAAPKAGSEGVRYYRLENGAFTEIDAPPARAFLKDSVNPDASMRILSVMEQAAMIKQPDLRDRAYLDVVDYAVFEGLFVPASTAMEKIKQVELRDTARSRIAITLAEKGDSVSAFELIDEVEVDELRDVMRLQVIEALIAPQPEAAPRKRR